MDVSRRATGNRGTGDDARSHSSKSHPGTLTDVQALRLVYTGLGRGVSTGDVTSKDVPKCSSVAQRHPQAPGGGPGEPSATPRNLLTSYEAL